MFGSRRYLLLSALMSASVQILDSRLAVSLAWGIIALAAGLVLVFVLIGLIQSTLNGIYTAAIYQYAIDERTGFFDEAMIRGAFVSRS